MFKNDLMQKTKLVYESIASDFGASRANPWYEFEIYKQDLVSGDALLDLGCGNARLAKFLPDFVEYHGIDASQNLLNLASDLLNKSQKKNWKLTLMCMLVLLLPKAYFQRVVLVASYHHILSRRKRIEILNKLYATLQKDGELYISVWNLFQKRYVWQLIKSFLALRPFNLAIPFKGKVRYYHAFTPRSLKRELLKSKFENVEITYVTHRKQVHNFYNCNNMVIKLKK